MGVIESVRLPIMSVYILEPNWKQNMSPPLNMVSKVLKINATAIHGFSAVVYSNWDYID